MLDSSDRKQRWDDMPICIYLSLTGVLYCCWCQSWVRASKHRCMRERERERWSPAHPSCVLFFYFLFLSFNYVSNMRLRHTIKVSYQRRTPTPVTETDPSKTNGVSENVKHHQPVYMLLRGLGWNMLDGPLQFSINQITLYCSPHATSGNTNPETVSYETLYFCCHIAPQTWPLQRDVTALLTLIFFHFDGG